MTKYLVIHFAVGMMTFLVMEIICNNNAVEQKFILQLRTYVIGHFNPSVRIIDLVSHTTYVVCVNFIHKWRGLQFKIDSERQNF